SEFVTINVRDAKIAEVLKAYSLQTGQSIVVGPDVISENVNVRLNNIPWEEALDVILKPYGFGYRVVGDTIVISKLENIVTVEGIEPLASKVFTLKYLDAYDINGVIAAQLSPRGKLSIPKNRSLPGWEFGGGDAARSGGGNTSQGGLGAMKREQAISIERSKLLIVTDVPASISRIEGVIEDLDLMPTQVLIESRFIEIATDTLFDLGLDFGTGANALSTSGVQASNPANENQWGLKKSDSQGLTPAVLTEATGIGLSGALPFNSGLQLLFANSGDSAFEFLLHALQEDGDIEILSAPRVLTQNNQEAAIMIGEKFPIIESQSSSSGSSGTGTLSTSLKYYENIGIQLNVIPQVCDGEYINMIVHPVVSSIDGFEEGVVRTSGGETPLTRYPRLKVREAQTHVLVRSEDSVVIGGLQNEIDRESVYKVPFIGDIPFIGRLFQRRSTKTDKIDLLIVIKATVINSPDYANESAAVTRNWEQAIEVEAQIPHTAKLNRSVSKAQPDETPESDAVSDTKSDTENEEILALVGQVEDEAAPDTQM
ncbi:MAG: secretin and TonB N-terminal domain-containing protein, partial [Pontiella sp.]|nr:secretin and TonB N-terminal domain-containing protein [Pontiella sp.]